MSLWCVAGTDVMHAPIRISALDPTEVCLWFAKTSMLLVLRGVFLITHTACRGYNWIRHRRRNQIILLQQSCSDIAQNIITSMFPVLPANMTIRLLASLLASLQGRNMPRHAYIYLAIHAIHAYIDSCRKENEQYSRTLIFHDGDI